MSWSATAVDETAMSQFRPHRAPLAAFLVETLVIMLVPSWWFSPDDRYVTPPSW